MQELQAMAPVIEAILCECADVARSEQFYRDTLGFPVLSSSPHWVELKAGGVRVVLHPSYSGIVPNRGGWVLSFVVESVSDFRKKLVEAGVEVGPDHEIPGGISMAFEDWDGNRLQAIEKR
ncbi:VOC family protein [bacterium]|nr:MAG: VOC family protein [bacterium]